MPSETSIDDAFAQPSAEASVKPLRLWETYSREEAHDIFDPGTTFTPQTGTWGLQGIVRISESPGDFVFFVTFGATQGDHDFDEDITEDGVLTWQSQPAQRLATPMIKSFIQHDDLTNSIHLFLRTSNKTPYTYFGTLGYLSHDPAREAPVHFTWQLMDWPPPDEVLNQLDIKPAARAAPEPPVPHAQHQLLKTDPPNVAAPTTGPGQGSGPKQAVLPGQDAKNRKLGIAGEELVLRHERANLAAAGRQDLADQIVHVAKVEGDSAGYDIRSYRPDGTTRHIEVKTTAGPRANAFYISPNEVDFSAKHPDTYVLIRIYGYDMPTDSAKYYEVAGPIEASFALQPSEYRARLLPTTP